MNTSHIFRTTFRALLATATAFAIAGCVAPVGDKTNRLNGPFYADPERRVIHTDGTVSLLPEIITPSSGKSIAVTDIAFTKRADIENRVTHGELRGVSADIRALLIKSGYPLVAARPAAEEPLQDDRYSDILGRIKAGDFRGADYVLYGVLTRITINEHNESIVGTRNNMQFHVLDLAIDFSLIDTRNSQVVASFTAVGSGREQRIDGKPSGYKPSLARMVKQASLAMADEVALQLNSQNMVLSESLLPKSQSAGLAGNTKWRNDEEARSLRIYR